jgi:polyhydroxyalkanoate synthesis regulator phasin
MRERGEATPTPDDDEIRNKNGKTAKEFIDKLVEDGELDPAIADSATRAANRLAKIVNMADELLADPENKEKHKAYSDALVESLNGNKSDALNLLGAGVMAIVVLNKFGGNPKFSL